MKIDQEYTTKITSREIYKNSLNDYTAVYDNVNYTRVIHIIYVDN